MVVARQLQVSVSTCIAWCLNPLKRFCLFVVDCSYICNSWPNDHFMWLYDFGEENDDMYCISVGFTDVVVQYFDSADPSATYEHC